MPANATNKSSARAETRGRARPSSTPIRHRDYGHGRRLTSAFEALEGFPALAASRDRLVRVSSEPNASIGDLVAAIESDVALAIAVLRIANNSGGKGDVATIPDAVERLSPAGVAALATRTRVFDFFEKTATWDVLPDRFRLHSVATQRAAERLAREVGYEQRDELLVSALMHDIGKLALLHAYPGYPEQVHGDARTPEERVHKERVELGVDHAVVGGVLARRWNLPARIAGAIERHHAEEATEEAALIKVADMLAHYGQSQPVDPAAMLAAAREMGLTPEALRTVMYELPYPTTTRRRVGPCPLSTREVEVLRQLAEGKVYKQIALELGVSASTVRTHLHNTYGKLGAVDRAQAVLMATERGWL